MPTDKRGKVVIESAKDLTTAYRRALSDVLDYFLANYGNTGVAAYIGALHASLKFMQFTEYKVYMDESTMGQMLDRLVEAGHLIKGDNDMYGNAMYGHADKVRNRVEDTRIEICDEAVDLIVEGQ